MTNAEPPERGSSSGSEDFEARLRAARARQERARGGPQKSDRDRRGMAVGFRIAVEMAAAIGVSVGLGLLLDDWLGTKPWMMILLFILGCAAAFMNVMRLAHSLDEARRREKGSKPDASGGRGG